jgi:large subunit ribosomal protein L28
MPSTHPSQCEICGRGPRVSNQVSHAHNVSKRRQQINVARHHVVMNGTQRHMAVCTRCLRSGLVQKAGRQQGSVR